MAFVILGGLAIWGVGTCEKDLFGDAATKVMRTIGSTFILGGGLVMLAYGLGLKDISVSVGNPSIRLIPNEMSVVKS